MPRHRHGEHSVRYADGRTHGHDAHTPHRIMVSAADYTFGYAGHQLRIGPILFWSIVGALVIMAAWTLATASYFAFHDDLLTRLIARETQMQYGYEDRIAELRMQVDRAASRQLLDQEQYEKKLDALVRRESLLESRAATLSALPDPTSTGSIRPPRTAAAGDRPAAMIPKPSPISDTVILVPPPDRQAQLESRAGPLAFADAGAAGTQTASVSSVLARLESSLNHLEARQVATLNGIEESYDTRARKMRVTLADLGLDLGLDLGKAPPRGPAMGGPFVPAKLPPETNVFERQIYRINLARSQVDLLNRTLVAVPIRKPIPGEIDTTSGFGVRLDPFLHRPAMHTGLDFRGEMGEPIHATAAGTVTHAGLSGGYGKMVEIDHGNGLATRYGHLSEIDAQVGQAVRIGQVIGKLGSTGRSTGPHLHYETRIEGEAVDPQKFLRAGLRLGGL